MEPANAPVGVPAEPLRRRAVAAALQAFMAVAAAVITGTYLDEREWSFAVAWVAITLAMLVLAVATLGDRRGETWRSPTTAMGVARLFRVAVGMAIVGALLNLAAAGLAVALHGWGVGAVRTMTFGVWATLFATWFWFVLRPGRLRPRFTKEEPDRA